MDSKKTMPIILIERHTFNPSNTIGTLYLNGKETCFTLEDTARAEGVKIKAQTCIPEGVYDFVVTPSPRFQRNMVLIYNRPGYALENKGIRFEGIRIHGGNTEEHTEGCPLVAYNVSHAQEKIWGTAEKEITEWAIAQGGKGWVVIKNGQL